MKRNIILILVTLIIVITSCNPKERLTSPDHYILKKSNTEKVKVKGIAEFKVEIIPTDGYKMEVEAPIKLKFSKENNPDIEFEKEIYTKDDIVNKDVKKPIFNGKFIPQKEGSHNIKGELSFVVCTSSVCEPKKVEVEFNLLAE